VGQPVPFDTPNFLISNIDGKTGRVTINKDVTFSGRTTEGDLLLEHAQLLADGLSPRQQLAVRALRRELPRHDHRRARTTTRASGESGFRARGATQQVGGLMKINASTGQMTPIYQGRAPGNGAVLTTGGDLVFWGDLDHKFRAFDAISGRVMWEQRSTARSRTARSPMP
jgi:predicted aconitase with swiveling domain